MHVQCNLNLKEDKGGCFLWCDPIASWPIAVSQISSIPVSFPDVSSLSSFSNSQKLCCVVPSPPPTEFKQLFLCSGQYVAGSQSTSHGRRSRGGDPVECQPGCCCRRTGGDCARLEKKDGQRFVDERHTFVHIIEINWSLPHQWVIIYMIGNMLLMSRAPYCIIRGICVILFYVYDRLSSPGEG